MMPNVRKVTTGRKPGYWPRPPKVGLDVTIKGVTVKLRLITQLFRLFLLVVVARRGPGACPAGACLLLAADALMLDFCLLQALSSPLCAVRAKAATPHPPCACPPRLPLIPLCLCLPHLWILRLVLFLRLCGAPALEACSDADDASRHPRNMVWTMFRQCVLWMLADLQLFTPDPNWLYSGTCARNRKLPVVCTPKRRSRSVRTGVGASSWFHMSENATDWPHDAYRPVDRAV
jgi:hypothetical protein